MTSFYLSHFCKDPVSKHSHILRAWGLGLPHVRFRGHSSASDRWCHPVYITPAHAVSSGVTSSSSLKPVNALGLPVPESHRACFCDSGGGEGRGHERRSWCLDSCQEGTLRPPTWCRAGRPPCSTTAPGKCHQTQPRKHRKSQDPLERDGYFSVTLHR